MKTEIEKLPTSIVIYGRRMVAIGRGKYPHDCNLKREYPNAMIYTAECTWTSSESHCFANRDKSLDRYDEVAFSTKVKASIRCDKSNRNISFSLSMKFADTQGKSIDYVAEAVLNAILVRCNSGEGITDWDYNFI